MNGVLSDIIGVYARLPGRFNKNLMAPEEALVIQILTIAG